MFVCECTDVSCVAGWLAGAACEGQRQSVHGCKKLEQESAKNCYIVWGCIKVAEYVWDREGDVDTPGLVEPEAKWQFCLLSQIHGMAM